MWDTFLSLTSSWAGKTIICECWDVCVQQHVVIKYYSQALLAVVLSLELPIMKSLKDGRERFIDKISTISVLSWLNFSSFLHTKMEISWDRCHIYQECESKREEWFNGTIIYRTLLDNLLQFKKEDCLLIAIKFGIEYHYSSKQMQSHLSLKLEKAN